MSTRKKKNAPASDDTDDLDLSGDDVPMDGDDLATGGTDDDGLSIADDGLSIADDGLSIADDKLDDMPEFRNDAQHPLPDELGKLKGSLTDQIRQDTARFQAATDTEYWFCVQFDSREQKEAFLRAMNWLDLGDKYLYGDEVAERQGIDLPDAYVPFIPEKPDAMLNSVSAPLKKQTADVPAKPAGKRKKGAQN